MPARILLIEDNLANLDLMKYLLGAYGHEILSAKDGETGLHAALRESPDLVICDLQLPVVSGYGVARVLKSNPEARDIPLVAVTAFAMVGDRESALSAGFDGYLTKPIDPETFVRQIEQFLPPELRSQAPPGAESRSGT